MNYYISSNEFFVTDDKKLKKVFNSIITENSLEKDYFKLVKVGLHEPGNKQTYRIVTENPVTISVCGNIIKTNSNGVNSNFFEELSKITPNNQIIIFKCVGVCTNFLHSLGNIYVITNTRVKMLSLDNAGYNFINKAVKEKANEDFLLSYDSSEEDVPY